MAGAHDVEERSLPPGMSVAVWATMKLVEVCDQRLVPADLLRCRSLGLGSDRNIVDPADVRSTYIYLYTYI